LRLGLLRSGQRASRRSDGKAAIAAFSKAIAIDPNYELAYADRGFDRYLTGDKKGAIEDFDQVVRLQPNQGFNYLIRGDFRAEFDTVGAIADFDQSIRLGTMNRWEAYCRCGEARSRIGDNLGAIEDYGKAIDLDPTEALARIPTLCKSAFRRNTELAPKWLKDRFK